MELLKFLLATDHDPRDADAAITGMQSFCVAGRCAVLPRFSEHWRRWQLWSSPATDSYRCYVRVVRCTSTPLSGWCLRYFICCLRSSFSTPPITRLRWCMLSWPGKQLHCIKSSSKCCTSCCPTSNRIKLLLISRRLPQLPFELYSATQSQCLLFLTTCVFLLALPLCYLFWMTYCSIRSSVTQIRLNTTCVVHRLAFHTCVFPHLPVLQFGAAFSGPTFFDHAFLTVPRFPVSRFQSPQSCFRKPTYWAHWTAGLTIIAS